MINAGALVVHTLVGEPDDPRSPDPGRAVGVRRPPARGRRGGVPLRDRDRVPQPRHRQLLRSHGTIREAPEDVVVGYTRQCAVRVNARDLALMAATLANGGINPLTEEQVVDEVVVRQMLSVMSTSGMYDAAGDWTSTVGFPAKSGVSGASSARCPASSGSRRSHRGWTATATACAAAEACRRLSHDMGLHMMDAPQPARATIRRTHTVQHADGGEATVYALHGSIQFARAERLLRDLADDRRPPARGGARPQPGPQRERGRPPDAARLVRLLVHAGTWSRSSTPRTRCPYPDCGARRVGRAWWRRSPRPTEGLSRRPRRRAGVSARRGHSSCRRHPRRAPMSRTTRPPRARSPDVELPDRQPVPSSPATVPPMSRADQPSTEGGEDPEVLLART